MAQTRSGGIGIYGGIGLFRNIFLFPFVFLLGLHSPKPLLTVPLLIITSINARPQKELR